MIRTALRWYCTLCAYGKDYDSQKESPPVVCPACNNGQGTTYAAALLEEKADA